MKAGIASDSTKKTPMRCGARGRFLQKAPQKPFWTWRVRTHPSPLNYNLPSKLIQIIIGGYNNE
jgi:hypothetical protein